jgi:hypothetical protein
MKLTHIFLIFLALGIFLIIQSRDYSMSKPGDQVNIIKESFSWIKGVFSNIYDVTMYAVKKPWLPENTSILKKNNSKNMTNNTITIDIPNN